MDNIFRLLLILFIVIAPFGLIMAILYNVIRNYYKHNKQKDTKEDE